MKLIKWRLEVVCIDLLKKKRSLIGLSKNPLIRMKFLSKSMEEVIV